MIRRHRRKDMEKNRRRVDEFASCCMLVQDKSVIRWKLHLLRSTGSQVQPKKHREKNRGRFDEWMCLQAAVFQSEAKSILRGQDHGVTAMLQALNSQQYLVADGSSLFHALLFVP